MKISKFCENCGAAYPPDGRFCENCGAAIERDVPQQADFQKSAAYNTGTISAQKQPYQSKQRVFFTKKTAPIFAIAAAVVIITLVLVVVLPSAYDPAPAPAVQAPVAELPMLEESLEPAPLEIEAPAPEPLDLDEFFPEEEQHEFDPEPPEPEQHTDLARPEIGSVDITFAGAVITDFAENAGTRIPVSVRIAPVVAGEGADILWYSTNPGVAYVAADDHTGLTATITHISSGIAVVRVVVNGEFVAETYARTR